jgi:O-antigen/teichoic acid export membrane protein
MGSLSAGVLGFIFHFYMGRILGPADYSVLGVILSIVYIMGIGLNTLQTGVTKYTSDLNAKKEYSKISYLMDQLIKKLTKYGIILFILFLIITPLLAKFLHIGVTPLLIISPCILILMVLPVNRGSLQGLQRFKGLSWNLVIEGVIKLFGAIILVLIGLSFYGAIIAIVVSYLIPFFAGFYPLRDIIKRKKKKFNISEIYKFSIPILIALISLTLFYNIDVILIKHFFSEIETGYYVAASKLGLILFFATISISQVMFPKVSELYKKKEEHFHLLKKSLLISLVVIIPAIIIFYSFPKLIVNILFGPQFFEAVPYVGPFSIMIGLFSLIYIITFYNLSINKKKFLFVLVTFNIIQILLITLFHSTLTQIINILIVQMVTLFIIMLSLTLISKNGRTINNNSSI